ncbi:MAG: NmrA family NAD(P)-binding protein [Anaerolineae bacterium]
MILVTGAAGKTGQAVIRALNRGGRTVRALVHRPQQAQEVAALGAQDVVVGDMRLRTTMDQAARAARAVYHICPNMSPDEVEIGQLALDAARAAGVEHFVYHSVLHPQTEAMPHHWQKLRVEESILESGLPFTILQPAAYMQNVMAYRGRIIAEGVYAVPYAVETRLSMVDLEDVAAVAALVLAEPGHAGATYELAAADLLSQSQVAEVLEQHLGRPVQAQAVPLARWEGQARASGLGGTQIQSLLQMFRYYERYGFRGNANVLEWLLGRPPTTFAAFVARAFPPRESGSV